MADKISISKDLLDYKEIINYYYDTVSALEFYFLNPSVNLTIKYYGMSIEQILDDRKSELELEASLAMLTSVEATFRVDFLSRCYNRHKDIISKEFRSIYKRKKQNKLKNKISLEEDILDTWKKYSGREIVKLMNDLLVHFKYRHWLAHGRYWEPKKMGRKLDYFNFIKISELVSILHNSMNFIKEV